MKNQQNAVSKTDEYFTKQLESFKVKDRHPVHSFHRYFGKLIPAIPSFAIAEFTKQGDLVLDPFSGSGTTAVESQISNRAGVAVDINPLANFITKVKTTYLEPSTLGHTLEIIVAEWEKIQKIKTLQPKQPYVVNLEHWFRSEVLKSLMSLRDVIRAISGDDEKNFFLGVFSAFIRGVSNADPQHVFPGYSKRMRALDLAGRKIDVRASFIRAAKKRIKQVGLINPHGLPTQIFNGSICDFKQKQKSIDLIVTNPPYISSIRYLETMKIEMGWLDFIDSQSQYLSMDRSVIGTERFYKNELESIEKTGNPQLDAQIEALKKEHPKMAKTVFEYFQSMKMTFEILSKVHKKDGRMVIKISESKVRSQIIPTHLYFIQTCEELGYSLEADLIDNFDQNSRSLLTARNSYSGLMTYDHILILKR